MTVSAFCLLILFVPVTVSVAAGTDTIQNKSNVTGFVNNTATIENNIEILKCLCLDDWYIMDTSGKTEILQIVTDIEAGYLGIPYQLRVEVDLLDVETVASYNGSIHTIVLNVIYLEGDYAEKMLSAVCHECRHAYQYCLCDAYDSLDDEYKGLLSVREIQTLQDEFSNYIYADNGFTAYYEQKCETDARSYAEERTACYYEELQKYKETEKE